MKNNIKTQITNEVAASVGRRMMISRLQPQSESAGAASCAAGMAVYESPPKYKKHEAVLKKFIDKKRFDVDDEDDD